MTESNSYMFKVCVLGDESVGKTSLIKRFVLDEFSDKYISTIGVKTYKKNVGFKFLGPEGDPVRYDVKLMLWDLMGQEKYRSVIKNYIKGSQGVILISDATREDCDNIERINHWRSFTTHILGHVNTVYVKNKVDLRPECKEASGELEAFCIKNRSKLLFTSAKTGENVEKMFKNVARLMLKDQLAIERIRKPQDALALIERDFGYIYGDFDMAMAVLKTQGKKVDLNMEAPTVKQVQALSDKLLGIIQIMEGPELALVQKKTFTKYLRKL